MTTKVDFINGAYSKLRISGITVNPTTSDLSLALSNLENMMAEFQDSNIIVDYAFEQTPDLNTKHNVERKFWNAIEANLAVRLIPDFGKGKEPDPLLLAQQQGGLSFLYARTARIARVSYPARMPIGTKNFPFTSVSQQSYGESEEIQQDANIMYLDDVDDFTEDFSAWLNDSETISSYAITSDDGLTINSDSNTDTTVDYQVQADGTNDAEGLYQVKIVVTTSDSRKQTRVIPFYFKSSAI